jgi:hypothetical protein
VQLEKLVLLMSRMPDNEGLGQKMQQFFISTRERSPKTVKASKTYGVAVYKDLPHPPASFLGPVNNAAASTAPVPDKPRYA